MLTTEEKARKMNVALAHEIKYLTEIKDTETLEIYLTLEDASEATLAGLYDAVIAS